MEETGQSVLYKKGKKGKKKKENKRLIQEQSWKTSYR